MINADMRHYNYFLYGDEDIYGQKQISEEVQGTVKMAIYVTSQRVQNSILYAEAEYIGFTHDSVNDNYLIEYDDVKLKVLYVNKMGRFKQVFMARV